MRAFIACAVLLPALATADDNDKGFTHHKQFQISARLPFALRGIATYDEDYCGDTDTSRPTGLARVCTGRSPQSIDFELGYGIKPKVDLLLELRLGIEQDFGPTPASDDGPHVIHLSPGGRFFFSKDRMKFFTTAQLVIDWTGYENTAGKKLGTDFGVRNVTGLWIDFTRSYGLHVYVGETATFARWLRFELEAGVGIQGRYP